MPKHFSFKQPAKPGTNKKAAHRAAFSLERIAGIEPELYNLYIQLFPTTIYFVLHFVLHTLINHRLSNFGEHYTHIYPIQLRPWLQFLCGFRLALGRTA